MTVPERSEMDKSFSLFLRTERQRRGLTLDDLSAKSGLHRTSLSLIERGERGASLATLESVLSGLNVSIGEYFNIISDAEEESGQLPTVRTASADYLLNQEVFQGVTGLSSSMLLAAIDHLYRTLDILDSQLLAQGAEPISRLVELANLSSMIGNIWGAGIANVSDGLYERNLPHTFPDLLSKKGALPNVEIKIALESNMPKGHLAKEGIYLIARYMLVDDPETYVRPTAKEKTSCRGSTVWLWEVRLGRLREEDFRLSNTEGDSGKTAVVSTGAMKALAVVYRDSRINPYSSDWGLQGNEQTKRAK